MFEHQGSLACRSSTLAVLDDLARFMDHYSLFWGPGVISTIDEPGVCLHVSHQHSRFLSILTCFMDYYKPFFGVPKRFPCCLTPLSAYMSIINNRSFCPILVRFVHYDSSFWCPRAISTIDKPRCACTCRSSTFANFVDSDPFHGLLLTVLGRFP